MANVIDKATELLLAQLERLDALSANNSELVAAECMRATALNNTAKSIHDMGELYLKAEQMAQDGGEFRPGRFFARTPLVDVNKPQLGQVGAAREKALAWGDGSKTVINEMGEFDEGDAE